MFSASVGLENDEVVYLQNLIVTTNCSSSTQVSQYYDDFLSQSLKKLDRCKNMAGVSSRVGLT
jgi:hypothetical protein